MWVTSINHPISVIVFNRALCQVNHTVVMQYTVPQPAKAAICPAANKTANALASLLRLDDAEDGASGAVVVHTPALAAATGGAVAFGTVPKTGADVIKNPFSSKCFAAVAAARG